MFPEQNHLLICPRQNMSKPEATMIMLQSANLSPPLPKLYPNLLPLFLTVIVIEEFGVCVYCQLVLHSALIL